MQEITSLSSSAKPPRAIAIKANAADPGEIERLVTETVDVYGSIDLLILNAGIMPMAELEQLSVETYDTVMGLNVRGPLFLAQVRPPFLPTDHSLPHYSFSFTPPRILARENHKTCNDFSTDAK